MKKLRLLLIVLAVVCGFALASASDWAGSSAVQTAAVPDRGHPLLNKLDSFFESLMGGVLAPDSASKTLDGLRVESEQARARGAVTEDFFRRYGRIVRTVRLVMATDSNDPQAANAETEIGRFIMDILGQGLEADASVSQQINKLSEAVAKEIAALRRGLIERGIPFSKAAVDAVAQWKYEPTFVDGKPVEVILTVTVTFQL
jgi:hypothetical protein